jgi:hypothetical protein
MLLLFSTIHCHLDPSSSAALCTCELLDLLASRGMNFRALTTGFWTRNEQRRTTRCYANVLPGQRFQVELGQGGPMTFFPVSSRPDPFGGAIPWGDPAPRSRVQSQPRRPGSPRASHAFSTELNESQTTKLRCGLQIDYRACWPDEAEGGAVSQGCRVRLFFREK